jgi:hypothetical protein
LRNSNQFGCIREIRATPRFNDFAVPSKDSTDPVGGAAANFSRTSLREPPGRSMNPETSPKNYENENFIYNKFNEPLACR